MGIVVSLIKWLLKLLIYFLIFAAIVVLIPNLPPYTKFTSIKLSPTQERVGPLALNIALNNVQEMYKDKLLGPEAFQIYNGELYTSLATGEIVKVSPGGHVTFVTKIGQPCSGLTKEHICGRPLGFEIDEKTGTLYVADAYHGIWKVNLKSDKKQLLVSPQVAINGNYPKFFNSLVLAKNGDIYWTITSTDFLLKDGAFSLLTDPTGKFLHYNAAKNESKVLLDGLWFPNGLAMSPDNQFVVISETAHNRLLKYYIEGPRKGKSEVFVDGLPGAPDNLRRLPDGSGVLAALYMVFDENHPLLTRSMAEVPQARKFLARLQRLIEIPFEYLNNLYPHVIFEEIVYHIGHFKSVSFMGTGMSGLVQIDWNGNIVASYYNTDGTVTSISDAIVYNDKLYLGNPHKQDFIGSVQPPPLLLKAFTNKKTEAPKVTPNMGKNQAEKPKEGKPVASQAPKQKPKETPEVTKQTEVPKQKTQEPPKQKPQESPKQKPQELPKQKLQEPPKQKPQEPTKQTSPEPSKQKPQQVPKPATDKPVEKKIDTSKPTQQPPKPTQPPKEKPTVTTTAPKTVTPTPPKATTPPPKQAETKTTTPKPVTKPAAQEKPARTTTEKPQKAEPKTETKTVKENVQHSKQKQKETVQNPDQVGVKPEQIPVKEEIRSDTTKPKKETLKVIKKEGPTEIPILNNV